MGRDNEEDNDDDDDHRDSCGSTWIIEEQWYLRRSWFLALIVSGDGTTQAIRFICVARA